METSVILIIMVVVAAMIIGCLNAAARRKALRAWADRNGLRFCPDDRGDFEDLFPAFDCLRRGSSRFAYNVMEGAWGGRQFTGFDYHYTTGSGKSKQTHRFSAVVLSGGVPLKPLLLRPEGFLDKLSAFFGFDDIDFESAQFSREFYVKATDRKWAYDLLHPRAIELLLASPRFAIQFDRDCVMAWNDSSFSPEDYSQAAQLVAQLLDAMPDYLLRQQQDLTRQE